MPASRATARIRSGSRLPRPAYPASISSDCPAGVMTRVAWPPSTSTKKMSSVRAELTRPRLRTTAAIACFMTPSNAPVPSIPPAAEESQQEQEEVDEIEVKGESADDCVRAG